jgi:hypothetical protein
LAVPDEIVDEASGSPGILDIHDDSTGILWVLAYVERRDNPPPNARGGSTSQETAVSGPGVPSLSVQAFNRRWIHILFAFDLSSNVPVLAEPFDDLYLAHLLPDGHVVALEEDELGRINAVVLRMAIEP